MKRAMMLESPKRLASGQDADADADKARERPRTAARVIEVRMARSEGRSGVGAVGYIVSHSGGVWLYGLALSGTPRRAGADAAGRDARVRTVE